MTVEEPSTEDDTTEVSLRNWGLSGMPITWAWVSWQPVVSIIRAANTGFADQAGVQTALDVVFPGKGYLAANVCLAHPVTAEFLITAGDIDPDVDPTVYADVIRVELADDEDLELPDEQITYDFGDGGQAHDAYGWDHGYVAAGTYTVTCTIPIAGVLYQTSQEYTTAAMLFDPSEHTVVEVLEYVREHPDEAEAVLAAEEAGKQRVTILDKGI